MIDCFVVTELKNEDLNYIGTITCELIESDHILIGTRIKVNYQITEIIFKIKNRVKILKNPHKKKEYQDKITQLVIVLEIKEQPLRNLQKPHKGIKKLKRNTGKNRNEQQSKYHYDKHTKKV